VDYNPIFWKGDEIWSRSTNGIGKKIFRRTISKEKIMTNSTLKTLFEDYLYATNSFDEGSTVSLLIEEVFKKGFDEESLDFFSREYNRNQKQKLIQDFFRELELSDETQKYQIYNILSAFLIETTLLIQDQILPIFVKNLLNKSDFKLVFNTLKILTSKWDDFSDSIKKKIYSVFLKVLDNPNPIFIEEGVFEITKIVLNSKSSEDRTQSLFNEEDIKNFLKKLGKTALKSKDDPLYAAIESILQILEVKKNLISKETYEFLTPIFKRLSKKKTITYPARRMFVKISLSFVDLILMFENEFYDEEYGRYLKLLITKIVAKIDHPDAKYFLELLIFILKNTNKLPKIDILEPTFMLLRDLLNKKERMEDYIISLVKEIVDIIWPQLSDDDKDLFFQESEFGNSVI